MNKSVMIIGVAMIALLASTDAGAGACGIINGSFEEDGPIAKSEIESREPNGWHVSLPAGKFRAYVRTDWPTEGRFNLSMYSEWFVAFNAGDTGAVYQDVDLAGVEKIVFDLKLDTLNFTPWDPNVCNAVLLVDSDVVWQSSTAGSDVRGEYFDQVYLVEDKYRTDGPHRLSLGLRINNAGSLWEQYITHWDFVDCNVFCGGGGFLASDLNRDCYVDFNDVKLLVDIWLDEVEPGLESNLFKGDDLLGFGTVNFLDFAVLADAWTGDLSGVVALSESWLLDVELDDQQNLYHGDDVESSGIINFYDFAVLAEQWLQSSFIEPQE